MQITEFRCGVFSLTVVYSHVLLDGMGLAQFLNAVAELARGRPRPSVDPIWCREAIPIAPPPQPASRSTIPTALNLEYSTIDIPLHNINRIKSQFRVETGKTCSAFDVVAAIMWQSRTKAVGTNAANKIILASPSSIRPQLDKVLPEQGGYYLNSVHHAVLIELGGDVAAAPIWEIVGKIKDLKGGVADRFWRWTRGEAWDNPIRLLASLYDMLLVVDIRNVGFSEVDYGWGPPISCGSFTRNDTAPSCVIVKSPEPTKNVRLIIIHEERHRSIVCDCQIP